MGVTAFMPPQGLLAIAAYLPDAWEVRFADENISRATPEDFLWADAVFVSGMHIQAKQIDDIRTRAQSAGKVAVLGGPSVSGAPEMYPAFDYLHVGELGDATDRLIALLDESVARPAVQVRLETEERLPLSDFPTPAYDKARLKDYLIGTFQFSSGCPYRCEFCDIPALYGRQPRLKTPAQLTRELDTIIAEKGHPSTIYFVDDNFIGNKKATREMLPHLIAWQKKHGYPLGFACEATLNIAKQTDILALMREAGFTGIFVGIETPELDALMHMRKEHNASLPMYESIETLNAYGLEVSSGIILGLDTDTPETVDKLIAFIERSKIPMLTINLLQALPKTPLHERLTRAGRIVDDPTLESNVQFLRPYDEVIAAWRRAIAYAYQPERVFERFRHQVDATYPNRDEDAGEGQAQGGEPETRADAARELDHRARHPRRLPARILARLPLCGEAWPARRRARHGLHVAPPDQVHARGTERRAECELLLRQGARRGGNAAGGIRRRGSTEATRFFKPGADGQGLFAPHHPRHGDPGDQAAWAAGSPKARRCVEACDRRACGLRPGGDAETRLSRAGKRRGRRCVRPIPGRTWSAGRRRLPRPWCPSGRARRQRPSPSSCPRCRRS